MIAVDPVAFKREQALRLEATHAFSSVTEAADAVRELTAGAVCDAVICTFSVMRAELLEPALELPDPHLHPG